MSIKWIASVSTLTIGVCRYEAYGPSLVAYGGVAPSRHGTTMPRCRALPHTVMNMHYISFNSGL